MPDSRADVVSSFTIIKGSLIDETYDSFRVWDLTASKTDNLARIKTGNLIGARSEHWLRDVAFVLSRRFDPDCRDRSLVELAQANCPRDTWRPLLLWHMTRDEFLVRDFLKNFLYPLYRDGAYRIRTEDVVPYLKDLSKNKTAHWSGKWTDATTSRVASGLLRIAVDFGLLTGSLAKEFASYHLPEESFLYILHSLAHTEQNARRIVDAKDWHLFLMDASDVERELLRLHQFHKLHYEAAGSLAQLKLPFESPGEYARELCV